MSAKLYQQLLSFVVKVVQSRPSLPHERFNPMNPAQPKAFRTIKTVVLNDGAFVSSLKAAITQRETLHGVQTESGKASARVLLTSPVIGQSIFPPNATPADKQLILESLRTEHSDPLVRSLWYTLTRDGNGIAVSTEEPKPVATFNGAAL